MGWPNSSQVDWLANRPIFVGQRDCWCFGRNKGFFLPRLSRRSVREAPCSSPATVGGLLSLKSNRRATNRKSHKSHKSSTSCDLEGALRRVARVSDGTISNQNNAHISSVFAQSLTVLPSLSSRSLLAHLARRHLTAAACGTLRGR